jgi:hypothetical protein
MAMKPKRYSAGLALLNSNAAVKFTGMMRLGLVLVAFGVPVRGEWLAAALPRGTWKNRREIGGLIPCPFGAKTSHLWGKS